MQMMWTRGESGRKVTLMGPLGLLMSHDQHSLVSMSFAIRNMVRSFATISLCTSQSSQLLFLTNCAFLETGAGLEKSGRYILNAASDRGMNQLGDYQSLLMGFTQTIDQEEVV
jgi:hypothetical protein